MRTAVRAVGVGNASKDERIDATDRGAGEVTCGRIRNGADLVHGKGIDQSKAHGKEGCHSSAVATYPRKQQGNQFPDAKSEQSGGCSRQGKFVFGIVVALVANIEQSKECDTGSVTSHQRQIQPDLFPNTFG